MSDPLSPARGILVGLVLGLILWVLAIWIAKAWIVSTYGAAAEAIQ